MNQATKKIAGLIQKSLNKNQIENKIGRAAEDLETLIKGAEFEWMQWLYNDRTYKTYTR